MMKRVERISRKTTTYFSSLIGLTFEHILKVNGKHKLAKWKYFKNVLLPVPSKVTSIEYDICVTKYNRKKNHKVVFLQEHFFNEHDEIYSRSCRRHCRL